MPKRKPSEKKQPKRKRKPTFEECIDVIDAEIAKKRSRWQVGIGWMDFDDIAQIIRIHLYEKWHLYNPNRPLGPWVNTVATNQIRNLIDQHYSNYSRPCLRCYMSDGDVGCSLYSQQCSDCPLYKDWEKRKKPALELKIPASTENHQSEISSREDSSYSVEEKRLEFHAIMENELSDFDNRVYIKTYIEHKKLNMVTKEMKEFWTQESRYPGQKMVAEVQGNILKFAREYLLGHE